MNKAEQTFLDACRSEPNEEVHRAAYHDWLIDQGRGADAEALAASLSAPGAKVFGDLRGQILTAVEVADDEVTLTTAGGVAYRLFHGQTCCESVFVDDVCGDVRDLIGLPLTVAEESSNSDEPPKNDDDMSHTWTFYRLATRKGFVTIRWYGTSNGYYSESVDFTAVP